MNEYRILLSPSMDGWYWSILGCDREGRIDAVLGAGKNLTEEESKHAIIKALQELWVGEVDE